MGILDRYHRAGGFIQLLSLLETCGAQKRETFFTMIAKEDVGWELALRLRIITFEKVLNWPSPIVQEVISRLQPLGIAGVLKGTEEQHWGTLTVGLPSGVHIKVREFLNSREFSRADISASIDKLLMEARHLISQGTIKVELFDPQLYVPRDIENQLRQANPRLETPVAPVPSEKNSTLRIKAVPMDSNETRIQILEKENEGLKQRIKDLEMELEQLHPYEKKSV